MRVATNDPLIEDILRLYQAEIGRDLPGYRNHVYRMVNFSFAQGDFDQVERQKISIAGCFHDIGIWTADTFDYLPPSIAAASEYLDANGLGDWTAEISRMIDQHHKLRHLRNEEDGLMEAFRRGDLVDLSLGVFKCGLPGGFVRSVKMAFPNAGFHRKIVRSAAGWFCRHPLHPVPILKW